VNDQPAYEVILEAARELFSERGYHAVTIRMVAAAAGYSPAMVMKVMGSKEELFSRAAPGHLSASDLETPDGENRGFELARRVLDRRARGITDPYAMVPLIIQNAPEPEAVRSDIRRRYLRNIAEMIGDTTEDRRHASMVLCLLLGLAAGTHTLGLLGSADSLELARTYGRALQHEIDQCTGPRRPLPAPRPADS